MANAKWTEGIATQPFVEWLIWSFEHDAWWRPDARGYTVHIEQAGRYPQARAEEIVRNANWGRVMPNEAMLPVPAPLPEKPLCTCGAIATERAGKGGGPGSDLCARCWRDEFSDPSGADDGE